MTYFFKQFILRFTILTLIQIGLLFSYRYGFKWAFLLMMAFVIAFVLEWLIEDFLDAKREIK